MSEQDKIFTGSIPEIYDTHLVPLIFEKFADDLATQVAKAAPAFVLETAAGSGVVTRALAQKLSASTEYVVTDLNQPMLDRAASQQNQNTQIQWKQADALDLPFDDGKFDVACCQFGVMFFPDRVKGFSEAHRVLKQGGQFSFNVWDKIENNEFAHHVTMAAGEIFPDDPPLFLARTPHGYHDTALIHAELTKAGFKNISISTKTEDSVAPSAHHAAYAYCHGTPLRNEIETRNADYLDLVTQRATDSIAKNFGNSQVSGKIQGHVVTAYT